MLTVTTTTTTTVVQAPLPQRRVPQIVPFISNRSGYGFICEEGLDDSESIESSGEESLCIVGVDFEKIERKKSRKIEMQNKVFSVAMQFFFDQVEKIADPEQVKKQLDVFNTGAHASLVSSLVLQFLQSCGGHHPSVPAILQKLISRLEIGAPFVKFREERAPLENFSVYYLECMNGLTQKGDGFAFLGGYRGEEKVENSKTSGHVMMYEVEKLEEPFYCFRKVNAGEGLLRYNGIQGLVVQDIKCYNNILISESFIEVLCNHSNKYSSTQAIEGRIKELFKGCTLEHKLPHFVQCVFGSCTMTSTWAWLEYHFSEEKEQEMFQAITVEFADWSRRVTEKCYESLKDDEKKAKLKDICELFTLISEANSNKR